MTVFDKDYFENGIITGKSLYSNYRWIPDLTYPMAFRIIEFLEIKQNDTILDFGCAKGYLVKAFRNLYRNCFGVDISDYCIDNADTEVKNYVKLIKSSDDLLYWNKLFDFVLAKDVLEHIKYEDIERTIYNLSKITKCLFCVVPLGKNNKYIIEAYEHDITHIIRENEMWWIDKIKNNGFRYVQHFDKIDGIKDNWRKENSKGNGFFVAKK